MDKHRLIRQISDPILHQPGKQADFVKDAHEIQRQSIILEKCRKATGGIGIAANQCAEIENPLAMVIVGIDAEDAAAIERYKNIGLPEKFCMINPVVLKQNSPSHKLEGGEGCLSVMGSVRGDINRQTEITVSYYDPEGRLCENKTFTGMTAIIIQHELDHILNGKVYLQDIFAKLTQDQKTQLLEIIDSVLACHAELDTESPDPNTEITRDHLFFENNGIIEFDAKKVAAVFGTLATRTLTGIKHALGQ